jgi:hypothetical protein
MEAERHRHPVEDFGARDGSAPLLVEAALQLSAYFAGRLIDFDLPVRLHGTPFQQRVWAALADIPYGETVSYGELAAQIGQPTAAGPSASPAGVTRSPSSFLSPGRRLDEPRRLRWRPGSQRYLLRLEQRRGRVTVTAWRRSPTAGNTRERRASRWMSWRWRRRCMLYGAEHVGYIETDGKEGHDWRPAPYSAADDDAGGTD